MKKSRVQIITFSLSMQANVCCLDSCVFLSVHLVESNAESCMVIFFISLSCTISTNNLHKTCFKA